LESFLQIVLVALIGGLITLVIGVYRSLADKINKTADRTTYIETKVDIYLEHAGFDVHKVNSAIKNHLDELMQNDRPSVGCINVKELYRAKED